VADKKPTKAERRDEAKTRRIEEMRRRERKARTRKLVTSLIVLVVVAGAVVGIVLASQNSKKDVKALNVLAAQAGCTDIQTFKDQGQVHINPPATFNYNSKPPTSGSHYPSPDQTGVHTAQIQNETQVHNLEHGHVIIHYNGLSDALITKLEGIVKTDPTRIVVEPYKDMPYKVAMTAWTTLIGCDNPNDKVVDLAVAFTKKYKGNGPEGDLPGTPRT
jgi:hypothetical protein